MKTPSAADARLKNGCRPKYDPKAIYEDSDNEEDKEVDITPHAQSPWDPLRTLFKGGFCERPRITEYSESQYEATRNSSSSTRNLNDPPKESKTRNLEGPKKKSKKRLDKDSTKKGKSKSSSRRKRGEKDDKKSTNKEVGKAIHDKEFRKKGTPKKSAATPPLETTEADDKKKSTWESKPRDFSSSSGNESSHRKNENKTRELSFAPENEKKAWSKRVQMSEEKLKKIVETMWIVLIVLLLVMWTLNRVGFSLGSISSHNHVEESGSEDAEVCLSESDPPSVEQEGRRLFSLLARLRRQKE